MSIIREDDGEEDEDWGPRVTIAETKHDIVLFEYLSCIIWFIFVDSSSNKEGKIELYWRVRVLKTTMISAKNMQNTYVFIDLF